MYEMFNEFNNEINELKSDYLTRQDEEIDDVTENASLVYKNQLKFFDNYILQDKQRTPTNKYLNQDLHHHHYQYDFHHKILLLKE